MNSCHTKRANKASKFDKRKQYNAFYSNNTPNNQASLNNQKDNADGNAYNNTQRR